MVHSFRAALYRLWGRVPTSLRRRLVRLFSPSFTVGANCVIIDDGRLMLVRHSYREHWGLPGGLVGRGEDPSVAAVRETSEEIGLDVVVRGQPAVVVRTELQQIDFVFDVQVVGPPVASPRSAEILEARWFALDELPTLQREAAEALAARSRTDG